MEYLFIILISIGCSLLSFRCEITEGNITHLQNGREPKASAAMFPVIPVSQLFVFGITYALEWLFGSMGFMIVLLLQLVLVCYYLVVTKKLNVKFAALVKQSQQTK